MTSSEIWRHVQAQWWVKIQNCTILCKHWKQSAAHRVDLTCMSPDLWPLWWVTLTHTCNLSHRLNCLTERCAGINIRRTTWSLQEDTRDSGRNSAGFRWAPDHLKNAQNTWKRATDSCSLWFTTVGPLSLEIAGEFLTHLVHTRSSGISSRLFFFLWREL